MSAIASTLRIVGAYFTSLRLADIIDIAIIAFIIYKIIRSFRGSGASRVIRGILIVVVLLWISSLLRMNVLSFLLGKAFDVGILALVVIFQPELRRVLERVGSGKLSGLIASRQNENRGMDMLITQTVIACLDMAKSKVGALIIFERDIKLDAPIKTGTLINADPTSELFKNIFYPKAPLHDGAVIVRNGKIAAAGCMLPLSNNMNLSRDLGMRHRAGMGMSEQSDAVVVIVSEETGSISVAVNGTLKRHLAADIFEKIIRNELMPERQDRSKKSGDIRNVLRNAVEKKNAEKQDR